MSVDSELNYRSNKFYVSCTPYKPSKDFFLITVSDNNFMNIINDNCNSNNNAQYVF